MRPTKRNWLLIRASFVPAILLVAICFFAALPGNADDATKWLSSQELDDLKDVRFSLQWKDAPLRERLTNFAKQKRVAIFIDRRIDPSMALTISVSNANVDQFLWQLAEDHGLGVCRIDNIYYVGEVESAAALPILWQELKDQTRMNRRKRKVDWAKRQPFFIEELSNPMDYLKRLSTENGFKFASTLPHDLWPEIALPSLSMDLQIALIGIGFGKWIDVADDGESVDFSPFESPKTGKISFGTYEDARTIVKKLRKDYPNSTISNSGKTITASGSPMELARIKSTLVNGDRSSGSPTVGDKTYTVTKTTSSRGSLLASIAKMIDVEFKYESSQVRMLSEQVTVEAVDASLDELLRRVMDGSNHTAIVADNRLTIQEK